MSTTNVNSLWISVWNQNVKTNSIKPHNKLPNN